MNGDGTRLRTVLETKVRGRRALVVGDVMLDRYIIGEVARISPEAPVPIVRLEGERATAGGAANVAANLAALGLAVTVAGWTGDDVDRAALLGALEAAGVDTEPVVAIPGRATTTKTRVLAHRQQLVRVDHEQVAPLSTEQRRTFDAQVLALLDSTCDVIVLSDYAKGVLEERFCAQLISRATDLNIRVLVDPKGLNFSKYEGVASITPNATELAAACRTEPGDLPMLLLRAAELRESLGLEALVVTRSEQGMTVLDAQGVEHLPAKAREVFDVSGAGDTAVATLAAGAAAGLGWRDAAAIANIAAGLAVTHAGTVAIRLEELLSALVADEEPGLGTLGRKIFDLATLRTVVERWRAAGATIGFTNGCFDLLHAGHVSYLDWARQQCDRLVVGVNTDSSVRTQKGPARPVVAERERATVIAGLAAVDAVVLFSSPTPIELIEALRPDVLVKGGDYREEEVIGAPEVKSWGGHVLLAPLVAGKSTTALVDRVRDFS